jgi:hypothetical protein
VNTRLGGQRKAERRNTQRVDLAQLLLDRLELRLGVALGRERDELPPDDDEALVDGQQLGREHGQRVLQ